jgi:hypothetical protein
VGVGDAFDDAVEAEAAQVVGHLVGAVVVSEESGDEPAKAVVGEAGDGVDDTAQGAGQGHGAWVPEAERSGSLALSVVGLVDALEERRADGTAFPTTACCAVTATHPGLDRDPRSTGNSDSMTLPR